MGDMYEEPGVWSVEALRNMNERAKTVRIYTDGKELSERAVKMLKKNGAVFREIDIRDDPVIAGWCAWAQGSRALPAIFVDGEPHGTGEAALEAIEKILATKE